MPLTFYPLTMDYFCVLSPTAVIKGLKSNLPSAISSQILFGALNNVHIITETSSSLIWNSSFAFPAFLHWIQMGLLRSGRRGSAAVVAPVAVRSLKVEKNCSISFCSILFRLSASSFARSALRSLISAMVYFFLSWSSSSWRLNISVSSSRLRCSKL